MSTSAPPDTLSIVLGNGPATTAFGLDIRLDGQDSVHTVHAAGPGIFRARRRPSDPAAGADGALLAKGSMRQVNRLAAHGGLCFTATGKKAGGERCERF